MSGAVLVAYAGPMDAQARHGPSSKPHGLRGFYRAQPLFQTSGHALQQQPDLGTHLSPRRGGVRGGGTRAILGVRRVALAPRSLAAEQDIQHDPRRPEIDLLTVGLAIADLKGVYSLEVCWGRVETLYLECLVVSTLPRR